MRVVNACTLIVQKASARFSFPGTDRSTESGDHQTGPLQRDHTRLLRRFDIPDLRENGLRLAKPGSQIAP
jgi:hypothetical protein